MKPIHKKRMRQWLEALRSTKYKQGRGLLCRHSSRMKQPRYCCLGVLCDISGLGKWELCKDKSTYLGSSAFLPTKVLNWLGFDWDHNFGLMINDETDPWSANDNLKWSFKKIADELEKHYLPKDVKRGKNV